MAFNPTSLVTASTATKYSSLASLTFLLYDHVLTFGAEVELVWNHPWSFGKALFIFNRYFSLWKLLADVIVYLNPSLTNQFCKGFLWWVTLSAFVANLSAEVILQARIYAVYECSRKILVAMVILCMVEAVSVLTINGLGIPEGQTLRPSGSTGCYDLGIRDFYFLLWVLGLMFQTILFFLMLYKTWMAYKDEWRSPLLNLIARDSVLYFLPIFTLFLVNCLICVLAPDMSEVTWGWSVAMACTLGSHLLLNMRERYFNGDVHHSSGLGSKPRMVSERDSTRPLRVTPWLSNKESLDNTRVSVSSVASV